MSRNGSGTYNLPAGNPVVTGTTVTSTWANSTLSDVANALTQSIAADGQTPITGNLNMASNKITALGTPSSSTDAVNKAYADSLIAGGSVGVFTNITDSALTSGRVTYATTAGLLTDSANLTFSGTTLTTVNSAYTGTLTGGTGVVNIGSGQIYKDSSGNVGIGTSSPSTKFHVNGGPITVSASSVGEGGEIDVYNPDGSTVGMVVDVSTANVGRIYGNQNNFSLLLGQLSGTGGSVSLYTEATEKMRITSAGLVGVGTSAPSAKLTVAQGTETYGQTIQANSSIESGNLRFTDSTLTNEQAMINSVNGGGLQFKTGSSSTIQATIDSSGNVGIGTSSPTSLLDVNADNIRVRTAKTPASASATGTAGQICWDSNYVYVCVATNTWKRSALSTW